MKKSPLYLGFLVLFSCGESEKVKPGSNHIFENFSYTVDTLMIDTKDEIINLSRGLGISSLSQDRKYLYQFDDANTLINAINLETLLLEKQYPFEREGPNGIGPLIFKMQVIDRDQVFMGGYNFSYGLYTLEGEKIKDISLNRNDFEGLEELEDDALRSRPSLSKDGKYMISLPRDREGKKLELLAVDLEKKSGKVRKISAMEQALDYNLEFQIGNTIHYYGDAISVSFFEDGALISNAANNKIYFYNLELDSLTLVEYDFALVPNQKEKSIKREVSSLEEFRIEEGIVLTQITFGSLFYDQANKRFIRFGRIWGTRPTEDQKWKGEFFLFVFDQDLKLIGETKVEGIADIPISAFFKDGKLWSYVNVNDELGFAVFTFDF
jgi:hypothetical protein